MNLKGEERVNGEFGVEEDFLQEGGENFFG